jgi:hypothetical protein
MYLCFTVLLYVVLSLAGSAVHMIHDPVVHDPRFGGTIIFIYCLYDPGSGVFVAISWEFLSGI